MNLVGRIFGTRKILKNYCEDEDFIKAGMKIPKSDEAKRKYVLGQCLNCRTIKPTDISNLYKNPPKRCSFCSNISHHSTISSYTNVFTGYEEEGYAVIDITFQGKIYPAYIDFEDLEKCKEKSWRISKKRNKFYVISGEKENAIYLHQFVFGFPPNGYEIDHIDGNSLNNRKNNLRYLTRGDNASTPLAWLIRTDLNGQNSTTLVQYPLGNGNPVISDIYVTNNYIFYSYNEESAHASSNTKIAYLIRADLNGQNQTTLLTYTLGDGKPIIDSIFIKLT